MPSRRISPNRFLLVAGIGLVPNGADCKGMIHNTRSDIVLITAHSFTMYEFAIVYDKGLLFPVLYNAYLTRDP